MDIVFEKVECEGFSEPRSGIEKPRSFIDVTDLRSVKSTDDEFRRLSSPYGPAGGASG